MYTVIASRPGDRVARLPVGVWFQLPPGRQRRHTGREALCATDSDRSVHGEIFEVLDSDSALAGAQLVPRSLSSEVERPAFAPACCRQRIGDGRDLGNRTAQDRERVLLDVSALSASVTVSLQSGIRIRAAAPFPVAPNRRCGGGVGHARRGSLRAVDAPVGCAFRRIRSPPSGCWPMKSPTRGCDSERCRCSTSPGSSSAGSALFGSDSQPRPRPHAVRARRRGGLDGGPGSPVEAGSHPSGRRTAKCFPWW